MARRTAPKTPAKPRRTRGGYPAGQRTAAELPPPPPSVVQHPGVLAAGGPVTPEDCQHPKARRDGKNPRLCRACGGPVPDGVK